MKSSLSTLSNGLPGPTQFTQTPQLTVITIYINLYISGLSAHSD